MHSCIAKRGQTPEESVYNAQKRLILHRSIQQLRPTLSPYLAYLHFKHGTSRYCREDPQGWASCRLLRRWTYWLTILLTIRKASISVLLVPAILGVFLRLFIIIRVQKQRISLDDYLLLVALGFLLASIIIMYTKVVDGMYLIWAVELGMINVTIPADIVDVGYRFHLYSNVCLLISWCSFSAVKLSFLFFFKKLIDRMRVWQIYWRIIFAYTVCVLIYGALVFFVSCPYFYSPKESESTTRACIFFGSYTPYTQLIIDACNAGKKKDQIVQESISLAVLDVVGDVLSKFLPLFQVFQSCPLT